MERVYLDGPTSEMLYTRDPNPVSCMERGFGFDETGKFHLLYYNEKGKVIRDFIIPSDPEPSPTVEAITYQMNNRIERERNTRKVLMLSFGFLAVTILTITFSVLYLLTHV